VLWSIPVTRGSRSFFSSSSQFSLALIFAQRKHGCKKTLLEKSKICKKQTNK